MVIGFGAALLLGILLSISIIRPLQKGTLFAKKMADGDFREILDIDRKDEIGILAKASITWFRAWGK